MTRVRLLSRTVRPKMPIVLSKYRYSLHPLSNNSAKVWKGKVVLKIRQMKLAMPTPRAQKNVRPRNHSKNPKWSSRWKRITASITMTATTGYLDDRYSHYQNGLYSYRYIDPSNDQSNDLYSDQPVNRTQQTVVESISMLQALIA